MEYLVGSLEALEQKLFIFDNSSISLELFLFIKINL